MHLFNSQPTDLLTSYLSILISKAIIHVYAILSNSINQINKSQMKHYNFICDLLNGVKAINTLCIVGSYVII